MSSDKRDFTNFQSFPGAINQETRNYEFPTLYTTSDSGKVRQWNIYVRLIKKDSKHAADTRKQNWNLLLEIQVPIKPEYLEDDVKFPDGLLSQVWTESGFINMKISRSAPTYADIKNKGKKNERNVFHQALVIARGKYLKKVQDGAVQKNELKNRSEIKETKYFPMLAKNYKDFAEKIKYPVYIQPKLDGLRCVIYLDKPPTASVTYTDVIMYTRQKKEYPYNSANDDIRKALLKLLKQIYSKDRSESVYLDGELYKHGKSLQNINSVSRGVSDIGHAEYHMYDMFYPSYTNESFTERTKQLSDIYSILSHDDKKYVKLVPTHLCRTKADDTTLYRHYLDAGYEGTMIRNPDGKYAKSATQKSSALRSKDLLKRKEVYDGEYEVIDFTQGNMGKDVGALVWVCVTPHGKLFNVVPNISYPDRYSLFKECEKKFSSKYANRMINIEYRSLSDDNVPQHAKGIRFRDFD